MTEFFGKVKKFFTGRGRQLITAVAAVFVVYVLLVSGIFSYFQSKDTVSNRLSSVNGSVTLREPDWDSRGQYMANAAEPGMLIPKNPYGLNDGKVDLFIRLKMTIELENFEDEDKTTSYKERFGYSTLPTEAERTAAQNKRRLQSIAEALRMSDGNTAFITLQTKTTGDEPLAVKDWKIVTCNNDKFCFDPDNNYADDNNDNDKLVFYFYYTNGDTGNKMVSVPSAGITAELFNSIAIPIYKNDYLGVFDQGYNIILEAEAIPSAGYENGLTAEQAKAEFDNYI